MKNKLIFESFKKRGGCLLNLARHSHNKGKSVGGVGEWGEHGVLFNVDAHRTACNSARNALSTLKTPQNGSIRHKEIPRERKRAIQILCNLVLHTLVGSQILCSGTKIPMNMKWKPLTNDK